MNAFLSIENLEDRIRQIIREEVERALSTTALSPLGGNISAAKARRTQRDNAMADDYHSGLTLAQVAERHGVHPNTVSSALKRVGVPVTRGPAAKGVADKDRAAEMARRYLGGETLETIGKAFGVTRERVRQILRKTGVASLGHRPEHCKQAHPLTQDEIAAAEMYEQGIRPAQIAVRYPKVNLAVVRERLGIPAKPYGSWNIRPDDAEITARVAELYRSGLSAPEIVERVPEVRFPETVYRYLRKAGIKPRRRVSRQTLPCRAEAAIRRERVLELHAQNRTAKEIAEEAGLSIGSVYRILKDAGLRTARKPPKPKPVAASAAQDWSEDTVSTLQALWSTGATASQIGDRIGRSRNAVLGKIHRLALNRCVQA